jgi:hypothetical protein
VTAEEKPLIVNVPLDEPQLRKIALLLRHEQSQIALRIYDCENVVEQYKKEFNGKQESEIDPVKVRLMKETQAVIKYLKDELDMLEVAERSITSSLMHLQNSK